MHVHFISLTEHFKSRTKRIDVFNVFKTYANFANNENAVSSVCQGLGILLFQCQRSVTGVRLGETYWSTCLPDNGWHCQAIICWWNRKWIGDHQTCSNSCKCNHDFYVIQIPVAVWRTQRAEGGSARRVCVTWLFQFTSGHRCCRWWFHDYSELFSLKNFEYSDMTVRLFS